MLMQVLVAPIPHASIVAMKPRPLHRVIQSSPPPFPLVELTGLFDISKNPESIAWTPFREGVEIHRLYGDGITGPTAALLRFRKAAHIPPHVHEGYEHIFVLAGSQWDHKGRIEAGTLRVHPPGTSHEVTSDAGCIVLAIYEKPVRFLEEGEPASELA